MAREPNDLTRDRSPSRSTPPSRAVLYFILFSLTGWAIAFSALKNHEGPSSAVDPNGNRSISAGIPINLTGDTGMGIDENFTLPFCSDGRVTLRASGAVRRPVNSIAGEYGSVEVIKDGMDDVGTVARVYWLWVWAQVIQVDFKAYLYPFANALSPPISTLKKVTDPLVKAKGKMTA